MDALFFTQEFSTARGVGQYSVKAGTVVVRPEGGKLDRHCFNAVSV